MEFEVWHAKSDKIKFGMGPRPDWPADYDRVAVVYCDSIEEAFRDTNHIDHSWQNNPSVDWHRSNRERSTSVDDVIIVHPPGVAYRCEMVGWEELGSVNEEDLKKA